MQLLFSRKFFPLFGMQFCGSFNDNFFKYAFIIIITIKTASVFSIPYEQIIALTATVFTIPYLFFSTFAGIFADKFAKSKLLIWIKFFEIAIMLVAAYAFITNNLELLLIVIFFMGTQTTFFGPVRYGLLPEIVGEKQLILGNALIQVSRFASSLLGIIFAGVLVKASNSENGEIAVAIVVVVAGTLGYIISLYQYPTIPQNSNLKISFNIFKSFSEAIKVAHSDHIIFISVLGISWFWFYSISILSIIPIYVHDTLKANQTVLTLILTIFIVAVSVGCFSCHIFSKYGKNSLRLVSIGAIGVFIFTTDIYFQGNFSILNTSIAGSIDIIKIVSYPFVIRVIIDLIFIAFFSGIYSIPLFALIQQRTNKNYLSRVIAANDLINAFFIMISGGILYVAFKNGYSSIHIFALTSVGTLLQGTWMFWYFNKNHKII